MYRLGFIDNPETCHQPVYSSLTAQTPQAGPADCRRRKGLLPPRYLRSDGREVALDGGNTGFCCVLPDALRYTDRPEFMEEEFDLDQHHTL